MKSITGRKGRDLPLHPFHVGSGFDVAPCAEDESVLRIEPNHRRFLMQVAADRGEDRFEDAGVQEEGRPQVESEAVSLEGRGPPPTYDWRSRIVTSQPAAESSMAMANPPGPAPMTTTRFLAGIVRSFLH